MAYDFDRCRYKAFILLGRRSVQVFSTKVHPVSSGRWCWVDLSGDIYCYCDQSQDFNLRSVEAISDEQGLAWDNYLAFAYDDPDGRGCAQRGRGPSGSSVGA